MSSPSYSLAVNTALPSGQMSLFSDKTCIGDHTWNKKGSHSEIITIEFLKLLKNANITKEQISSVYCVTGPGSFTGIRVGINFCKALAYSLNIPVIPINTLDLLSLNSKNSELNIVCAIDAQKNSVFLSEYTLTDGKFTPCFLNNLYSIDKIESLFKVDKTLCGPGFQRYQDFLPQRLVDMMDTSYNPQEPDLKNIFNHRYPTPLNEKKWFELQPLYIKTSAAEEKINPTKFN